MKFFPQTDKTDFSDCTLLVPTCAYNNIDQLAIDLLCFKLNNQVGRILSDNIDAVVSPNPYDAKKPPATSLDVYYGEIKSFGKVVIIRIAASLPKQKRMMLDLAGDIVEFAESVNIKRIVIVRSFPYSLASDLPEGYIGRVGELGCLEDSIKLLDSFDKNSDLYRSLLGDFFVCASAKSKNIPLSLVVYFAVGYFRVVFPLEFAKALSADETLDIPYSWDVLRNT